MSQELETIRIEEGKGPEEATIRNTGIAVAEIVKVFTRGGDPLEEFPDLVPMDLVAAGAHYGAHAVAFRAVLAE